MHGSKQHIATRYTWIEHILQHRSTTWSAGKILLTPNSACIYSLRRGSLRGSLAFTLLDVDRSLKSSPVPEVDLSFDARWTSWNPFAFKQPNYDLQCSLVWNIQFITKVLKCVNETLHQSITSQSFGAVTSPLEQLELERSCWFPNILLLPHHQLWNMIMRSTSHEVPSHQALRHQEPLLEPDCNSISPRKTHSPEEHHKDNHWKDRPWARWIIIALSITLGVGTSPKFSCWSLWISAPCHCKNSHLNQEALIRLKKVVR